MVTHVSDYFPLTQFLLHVGLVPGIHHVPILTLLYNVWVAVDNLGAVAVIVLQLSPLRYCQVSCHGCLVVLQARATSLTRGPCLRGVQVRSHPVHQRQLLHVYFQTAVCSRHQVNVLVPSRQAILIVAANPDEVCPPHPKATCRARVCSTPNDWAPNNRNIVCSKGPAAPGCGGTAAGRSVSGAAGRSVSGAAAGAQPLEACGICFWSTAFFGDGTDQIPNASRGSIMAAHYRFGNFHLCPDMIGQRTKEGSSKNVVGVEVHDEHMGCQMPIGEATLLQGIPESLSDDA
jgi:hypothetical protein